MAVCLDHVEQTSRKQRKVQNEAVLFYVIAGAEKNGGANILAMSINKLSLYSITALLNHMWWNDNATNIATEVPYFVSRFTTSLENSEILTYCLSLQDIRW